MFSSSRMPYRRAGFSLIPIAFLALLLVSLVALLVPQAKAQYLFNEQIGNHNPISVGMIPGVQGSNSDMTYEIAAADFNGDGHLDIAVLLEYACPSGGFCRAVQVYLGQPDGSFTISSTLHVSDGNGEEALTTGDMNGDGIPDLVVTQGIDLNGQWASEITSFLGKGDGTFQGGVSTILPTANASSLALGDFNADGKLDAAIGDGSPNGKLYIGLGKGDGTFTFGSGITLQYSPMQIAVADMNRDGKLDLVVAESYDGVFSVLLGNGDGTFGPELVNTSPNMNTYNLAVGDMNGDGIPDVVTSGNEVNVFLGNGDGTFQTPVATEIVGNPGSIVTGDFNGDGVTDVAMEGGWTGVLVLFGNNDGTFRTPGLVYGNAQGNIGSSPGTSLVVGDFNNDGKLDIATAPYLDSGDAFAILANNGDGTFEAGSDLAAGTGPTSVVTADFNGDGIPDFAIATADSNGGAIFVYLGTGKGQYGAAHTISTGAEEFPYYLAAGDFNHDNKIDLAAVNSDGSVSVLLGNGDGTFAAAKSYAGDPSGQPLQVATGDLNGDGNPDLVILSGGSGNGYVRVLLGNADGSFQAPASVSTGLNPNFSLQLIDVNGDKKLDILVNGNPDVSGHPANLNVLLGNGDGTFQAGIEAIPTRNSQDQALPEPQAFGAVDLRGNGTPDLVTNGNIVWPANGDGTFGQPIYNYGDQGNGSHIVFGDFNGDGKIDVAECGYNDAIWISLGNGDDTFGPQMMYNIPRTDTNFYCNALVAGDFNGDGSLDIAGLTTTDSSNGALTLLLSNPVLAFSRSSLPFPNTNVGSASAGMVLTVKNQSYTPLTFTGISIAGKDATDFAQTNTCGTQLGAGALCQVTVTFTPTAAGQRRASLSFNDSSAGSSQEIAISGVAPGPGATVNPSSLSFPSQLTGSSSAAQVVTLSNTGTTVLSITSIASSTRDFAQTNTCGALLAVGVSCQISVTFTPSVSGPITGKLTINDNAAGSPQSVDLSGTGATPIAITLRASPSTGVVYNQTVTLNASANQNIAGGKWWITQDGLNCTQNGIACGAAPNTTNGFSVATSPLSVGTHTFYAYYSATAPGNGVLPSSGTGQTAIAVGQATPTITWATPAAIIQGAALSSTQLDATASVAGSFAYNPPAGTVLNAGSQTLSVTFTPTDTTDYTTATHSVTLTVNPARPAVTLSSASLTFTSQNVGSSSAAQTVSLSNAGTVALSITSITASGDFAETNNCGTSVAAGASCTISVKFTPTAGGARTGTLTIMDNAPDSPETVALSGTGSGVSITPPSGSSGLSVSSPGGSATATLQLGSAGGFSGTVNLTCAVAYTGTGTANDPPTCSLNPNQETVAAGGTASVTLTVNTTGATSSMLRPLGGGAALAVLAVLFLIPRRRWSRLVVLLVLGLAATAAFTACGGGGSSTTGGGGGGGGNPPSNPGTTAGTYNVTVTASSGTVTSNVTIPLTVQ